VAVPAAGELVHVAARTSHVATNGRRAIAKRLAAGAEPIAVRQPGDHLHRRPGIARATPSGRLAVARRDRRSNAAARSPARSLFSEHAAARESCDTAGAIMRSTAGLDARRACGSIRSYQPSERTRMHYLLRFLRRGPISPRVHGTLDYLLAAALIAVPLVVDFDDDTATVLMLVLGGAATLLAIGTNWSTGIIRILPPVIHGVADIAATIVLIIAPFVLGFTDDTVATVLYVVIGAGGLGATLLTRFQSDLVPAAPIASQQPAL
jgi:hypothetical protein